eukprot:jgi/Ulvmu1/2915/UM147_0013.1
MTAAPVENAPLSEHEAPLKPSVVEPPAKQRCLAPTLKVKLLKDNAKLPSRGSSGAAGYDLSSAEACTIPARGKYIVSTGVSVAIPPECYGRVAPRSGLAAKHSIDVGAGVIDCDYRGELKVILFNFSDQDFEVKEGDRIAQLVLERIMIAEVAQVESLDGTDRGAGGFGSTGGFGNENEGSK